VNFKPAVLASSLALIALLFVNPVASSANAQPPKKTVVTTFTILADMARNVAGDRLIVNSITRAGAEIHGYQPTPSDIVRAQSADLVLYNGLNLERWFERFTRQLRGVPSVLLTQGITPLNISSDAYRGKPNPHAWMSPKNGLVYVENIRQAFVKLDPANAATYNQNAKRYGDQLRAIDTRLRSRLGALPANRRALVTCEGAFSYAAKDYGLQEFYLWPVNADEQGTPQQVRRTIDAVRQNRIPAVFCESTVSGDGMRQVAREAGARFGGVLYVDSLSAADGPVPTYLKLLEHFANTVIAGLTEGNR
jgi:ABC-type Zn uptake system ZnuABC Zn-binding protein ZnuA